MSLEPPDANIDSLLSRIDKLEKDSEFVLTAVDTICHYRNLAISLGAKPEDMVNEFDKYLCENWELQGDPVTKEDLVRPYQDAFDKVDELEEKLEESKRKNYVECAKIVCWRCKENVRKVLNQANTWVHIVDGRNYICVANLIYKELHKGSSLIE